jgi:hypothetical protein
VSAQKLLEYAEMELEKYSDYDMLQCMSNKQQIEEVVYNPQLMFQGPGGHNLAAILIQKIWKGYKSYSNFKQLKQLMKKASIIQRRFRLYMLKSKTNKKLKELRTDQMKVWT